MDAVLEIFFDEAGELLADFEAGLLVLEDAPGDAATLAGVFRAAHTIKGNAGMLGYDDVARFTHEIESLLDDVRGGRRAVTPPLVSALLGAADVVRRMLTRLRAGGVVTEDERASADASRARLATLTRDPPQEPASPDPDGVPTDDAGLSTTRGAVDTGSIRVPLAKVDRLINLVGELVITQSMVAAALADDQSDPQGVLIACVAQMDRHARNLHDHVLAMRMLPIRTLFSRCTRLVRDVASALGKQAVLEMRGEDTELDRTVIERIGDPLMHLLRNALDHGLETPAARVAAGKSPIGHVRVTAAQQGGNVFLEIADDGRGLDRDRLLARAVQLGLIAPDAAPNDDDVWALVFHPGLSTAAAVSEVSGRGVGMDVVRRNVEALGGSIGIRTTRGGGTTFRIKLPLTLAILDGQALRVGSEEYILPLIAITQTVRVAPANVHTLAPGAEVAVVQGTPIPVVRLHRLFDVTPRVTEIHRGLLVLIEHDGHTAGLLVDDLSGQQQVVIKSLETNFTKVPGIAGATILGDGRVALILDVAGLIALANAGPAPLRAVA